MKKLLIISRYFNDLELIGTVIGENSISNHYYQKYQELHHAC